LDGQQFNIGPKKNVTGLDTKHGQVDYSRNKIWDIIEGPRDLNGWEVNSKGYITKNRTAITGTPPAGIGGIKGGFQFLYQSSRVLMMRSAQLQSKFKHAADFGLIGNYNKANAAKFSAAINQHINSPAVQVIKGTYKGNKVIHYLNSFTGVNVISSPTGEFISGWKLGSGQFQGVLKNGTLW
jgi:hypothetical protein